jgi:hypothetical protein
MVEAVGIAEGMTARAAASGRAARGAGTLESCERDLRAWYELQPNACT